MLDSFNREIRYLRISVTDRCNLRCTYCMSEEGITPMDHSELLSFEQITEIVREAVKIGFVKLRLTGGEPLVRRDLVNLVKMLKDVEGIEFIGITTNGILLPGLALPLKAAGLDALNISLDTLDPEKYSEITRWGRLESALAGIDAALDAGFENIKINMVIPESIEPCELEDMESFCREKGLKLQRIRQYSLTEHKIDNLLYDRPLSCGLCDRLRLTSDGFLKPCLHSNKEIKVDFNDIAASLREAVLDKPARGSFCDNRNMAAIGG